ncbi:MAG: succinate--CoA ligase subunit alpha, partial [Actinomycetota bacterium]|nr:succinate--CoA ligase subunit alpha [Actinomycetota bacterium]
MSIIVDESTKVVVQGIGVQGTFHAKRNQQYGTRILAGVHPQRGGKKWLELGLPIFSNAADAVRETGVNTSLIMVPATFTRFAILDAYEAGIAAIVVVTEGMPVHDMTDVYDVAVRNGGVRLIGPNCPGVISPGKSNVGIIPGNIAGPGNIGLVSRSGTLTYQIMHELAAGGLGIST